MTGSGVSRAGGIRGLAVTAVALGALIVPALAYAHLERPSYWPTPEPDTSVSPPAGGSVPEPRPLRTATNPRARGNTHVVCRGPNARRSMTLLNRSIRQARRNGFRLRPSQDKIFYTQQRAQRLRQINRRLAGMCRYNHIQPAINAAGNNDRVVIMPGHYREPRSRAQPENDPRCSPDLEIPDTAGRPTPSYKYQVTCPHDQNLIYVQGREVVGHPPPLLDDRHGIPDLGPCVRCNLQIEGSGVRPEDVIMDAGTNYAGPRPGAKPGGHAKHVVLRVDRADGFVGRNFLMRGASEHGFYTEETSGVLLDRPKFFWNADYGHLSFTTDFHVVRNCHGFGSGDAVVYPGASPETGSQVRHSFYPEGPRFNTVIRNCDLHHSVLAYSGSMGNAVRITNNHVYATVAGIATDSISAQGHPGYPADGVQIDNNYIYSNNLNLYGVDDPPVRPLVGLLPVGTGIIWAGHNDGVVRDNWIFDNWRQGASLFAVPDALVEPEGEVNDGISCPSSLHQVLPDLGISLPDLGLPINISDPNNLGVSTSCGNRYFRNRMGVAPPGFRMHQRVSAMGNQVGGDRGVLPNGVDFWWDEFPLNVGNCWFHNTGPDGTPESVRPGIGVPPGLNAMPSNCSLSVGLGDVVKEAELLNCFLHREEGVDLLGCDWDEVPPQPQTAAARAAERERVREAEEFAASDEGERLRERMFELALDE